MFVRTCSNTYTSSIHENNLSAEIYFDVYHLSIYIYIIHICMRRKHVTYMLCTLLLYVWLKRRIARRHTRTPIYVWILFSCKTLNRTVYLRGRCILEIGIWRWTLVYLLWRRVVEHVLHALWCIDNILEQRQRLNVSNPFRKVALKHIMYIYYCW